MCVNSFSAVETVSATKLAIKRCRNTTPVANEAFNSMFSDANDDLVAQALAGDFIPFLLSIFVYPLEFIPNSKSKLDWIVR